MHIVIELFVCRHANLLKGRMLVPRLTLVGTANFLTSQQVLNHRNLPCPVSLELQAVHYDFGLALVVYLVVLVEPLAYLSMTLFTLASGW